MGILAPPEVRTIKPKALQHYYYAVPAVMARHPFWDSHMLFENGELSIGEWPGAEAVNERVAAIAAKIDANDDGTITFEELAKVLREGDAKGLAGDGITKEQFVEILGPAWGGTENDWRHHGGST